MTRHDHRGRFTCGSRPVPREDGAPLLCVRAKNPAAVALGRLSHERRRQAVLARMDVMRRELGLPDWREAR